MNTLRWLRERLAPPHTLVDGAYVDLYDCEKYVEYIDRHGSLPERPARLLMDAYLASGRPQRCRELAPIYYTTSCPGADWASSGR